MLQPVVERLGPALRVQPPAAGRTSWLAHAGGDRSSCPAWRSLNWRGRLQPATLSEVVVRQQVPHSLRRLIHRGGSSASERALDPCRQRLCLTGFPSACSLRRRSSCRRGLQAARERLRCCSLQPVSMPTVSGWQKWQCKHRRGRHLQRSPSQWMQRSAYSVVDLAPRRPRHRSLRDAARPAWPGLPVACRLASDRAHRRAVRPDGRSVGRSPVRRTARVAKTVPVAAVAAPVSPTVRMQCAAASPAPEADRSPVCRSRHIWDRACCLLARTPEHTARELGRAETRPSPGRDSHTVHRGQCRAGRSGAGVPGSGKTDDVELGSGCVPAGQPDAVGGRAEAPARSEPERIAVRRRTRAVAAGSHTVRAILDTGPPVTVGHAATAGPDRHLPEADERAAEAALSGGWMPVASGTGRAARNRRSLVRAVPIGLADRLGDSPVRSRNGSAGHIRPGHWAVAAAAGLAGVPAAGVDGPDERPVGSRLAR